MDNETGIRRFNLCLTNENRLNNHNIKYTNLIASMENERNIIIDYKV